MNSPSQDSDVLRGSRGSRISNRTPSLAGIGSKGTEDGLEAIRANIQSFNTTMTFQASNSIEGPIKNLFKPVEEEDHQHLLQRKLTSDDVSETVAVFG